MTAGCLAIACVGDARSQSADALLDKLVEKGVLTVKEANDLKEETDKNYTQAYATKSGMSEWVSALKFNGDFRGRFESFNVDNEDYTDRTRWRYRARFGVVASLFQNFEVGLRLGSGDGDPISNNQSYQDNGSKKGIFIDLAYAKWAVWNAPAGSMGLTIGKMENPFVFSDMVFDSDYTPEGAAGQFVFNMAEGHALKLNGGAFVLDEMSLDQNDPYMYGGQIRFDSVWSKKISTTAGVGMVGLTATDVLVNSSVPNINVGNTRGGDRALEYDYYPVIVDAALTYTLEGAPLYNGAFPIKIGGEYMYNDGAPSGADNYGWAAGITFGKAGKRKTWEVSYTYKWLGADSWWEELVDSDFGAYWKAPPPYAANAATGSDKNTANYYAGTNVRGHITRISYSPYDFLTLSAKWFYTDVISYDFLPANPSGNGETHRVQVDALLKF